MNKRGFVSVILVLIIALIVVILASSLLFNSKFNSPNDNRNLFEKVTDKYPKCPNNLEGILTYPFIDPKYLTAIIPLGNINPPGHTSPVDHNYFTSNATERIPIYAPSDNWINSITVVMAKYDGEKEYKPLWFTLDHQLCDGLVLTFANYTDLITPLKDIIAKQKDECKFDIKKSGHDFTEGQCYHKLNYKVKAGDLIGWTEVEADSGDGAIPFEIWAANYNKEPLSYVNWEYYNDDRYAHIMCTFDLYQGKLKNEYYSKLGQWRIPKYKDPTTGKDTFSGSGEFVPRTVQPLCGVVNQDIVGTIQGMWFGRKPKMRETVEEEGNGLAFVHNNIDPAIGVISVGGIFTQNKPDQVFINPKNEGNIDREFSQVKADGQIYCYNTDTRFGSLGKILVQLIDNNHLKVEYQNGQCSLSESFTSPYSFER